MHVPAAIRNRDETAARLAQPPGKQHLPAKQIAGPSHVTPALNFFICEKVRGVVAGDRFWIFLREVKRLRSSVCDHVEGLLLILVGKLEQSLRVDVPANLIEAPEQLASVAETHGTQPQLHVLLQLAAADRVECLEAFSELAALSERRQRSGFKVSPKFDFRVDRFRQNQRVRGDARQRIVCADNPRIDGAGTRFQGISTTHHFAVTVPGILRTVRPDNREFLDQLRQLRKRAAERDAGVAGLDLTVDAVELGRSRHFRIEELDVRRTTLQKQQDDGFRPTTFDGRAA